ncbi:MAG TPA: anhydro-N-acetylmuramic acid kinase [Lacipirellulaceae bacterium]|nr:anhydro-N-acetylmuramic acid kinase [Lacipirellulaceae bacterium]
MATVSVGLMSGTSGDGVDAALLDTDGENKIGFLGGLTLPYDDDLRGRLIDASQHDSPLVEVLRIEKEISLHHVRAVRQLLEQHPKLAKKVEIIGFHGHTVRHVASEGLTMQIGNPWLLSRELGLPVVADFRRCDMADGGQGAPLVGMFHRALFSKEPRPTLVLNLGGVANVTWLGESGEIIAGDTGPGCGLIDEWAQTMADLPHDRDGHLALAGQVDMATVEAALDSPYFSMPLPKSADRFDFDHVDVSALGVEDGAATLCAVTAEAVYRAVRALPAMPKRTWVTGGGVHHPVLMRMLGDRLGEIQSVAKFGLNPDTLEAECFAWLAVRHQRGLAVTLPETTGGQQPRTGGGTVRVA